MTVTNNATAADLDAAPAGSTLRDSAGDTAIKLQDGGWQWTHNSGCVSYSTPTLQSVWGPIRLTTPDLAPAATMSRIIHNATLQDLNDAPVGSHLLDRQGDTATKRADGRWSYPEAGWSNVKAGSVVRSFSPVTLTCAIAATLPDPVLPEAEPKPRIEHAGYDSVSKMASAHVDGKVYQINTANRSLADAAKLARIHHGDASRRATGYAKLVEVLETAQQEEAAEQEEALLKTLRAQVLTEAGFSRTYEMSGPTLRRFVDVAVAAKLELRKAQGAAK